MNSAGTLELDRGQVPKGRLSPVRVVPTLNVPEQCRPRLGRRPERATVDQLAFEHREETLVQRVIVAAAHRAPLSVESIGLSREPGHGF